jgi:hypothetical protein
MSENLGIHFVSSVPIFGMTQMTANTKLSTELKLEALRKKVEKFGWLVEKMELLSIDRDHNGWARELCVKVVHDDSTSHVHVSDRLLGSFRVDVKSSK